LSETAKQKHKTTEQKHVLLAKVHEDISMALAVCSNVSLTGFGHSFIIKVLPFVVQHITHIGGVMTCKYKYSQAFTTLKNVSTNTEKKGRTFEHVTARALLLLNFESVLLLNISSLERKQTYFE
jgi:hypothetical protein